MTTETFQCVDCEETKPVETDGGTGYADRKISDYGPDGKVCDACYAEWQEAYMREEGKIDLYLSAAIGLSRTGWKVTNWPGTLSFSAEVRRSDHNIAGKNGRRDVWFDFDGYVWHGVNIGDNQILRCKRTKKRA